MNACGRRSQLKGKEQIGRRLQYGALPPVEGRGLPAETPPKDVATVSGPLGAEWSEAIGRKRRRVIQEDPASAVSVDGRRMVRVGPGRRCRGVSFQLPRPGRGAPPGPPSD